MLKHAVVIVLLLSGLTANAFAQARQKPVDRALAWFAQLEERDFADYLKRVRLPKVPASFRAEVLAQLVASEVVTSSPRMQTKLSALIPILRFHEREGGIDIKVRRLNYAYVGVQGRAVMLISDKALELLTAEELQAVAAHELGHEYFWGEYQEARRSKQYELVRELELRCDGIALITLSKLGLNPASLNSALGYINTFNRRVVELDKFYHPPLTERLQFGRAMSALVKARETSARRL
jgi:hypothetical protein